MATMSKSRIATAPVHAVLPASNLARAEQFYHDVLGFEIEKDPNGPQFMARAGDGCMMLVYETKALTGDATAAMFTVDDLDATVADLRDHGIHLEEYDTVELKTVNGIATMGNERSAWFKDTEGNTIAIAELIK